MRRQRHGLTWLVILSLAVLWTACRGSSSSASPRRARPIGADITVIDPRDTAAYAEAGPAAVAAVARCQPPGCRPDIHRGPGAGELTVGLDSGTLGSEFQWRIVPETLWGGQALQDSAWNAMLTRWEGAKPQRLLLVDGVPRTYAYARDHVSQSSVWSIQQLSAKQAAAISSAPAAANGAIAITTKAHAPRSAQ